MDSNKSLRSASAMGFALGAISLLVVNALQGPTILTNVALLGTSALFAISGSAIAASAARRSTPGEVAPYALLALNAFVAALCAWMFATGRAGAGFGP